MPNYNKTCEKMALGLPLRQRAKLAERLLASLEQLNERENAQLWVEEAQRRYDGYKKGRITSRPVADVLRDARRKLQ